MVVAKISELERAKADFAENQALLGCLKQHPLFGGALWFGGQKGRCDLLLGLHLQQGQPGSQECRSYTTPYQFCAKGVPLFPRSAGQGPWQMAPA